MAEASIDVTHWKTTDYMLYICSSYIIAITKDKKIK